MQVPVSTPIPPSLGLPLNERREESNETSKWTTNIQKTPEGNGMQELRNFISPGRIRYIKNSGSW